MLIVFDLDDTLIDTSGSIAPLRLSQVANMVFFKKKVCKSVRDIESELKQIDETSDCSKKTLFSFFERHRALDLLDEALSIYASPLPPSACIQTTPRAKDVLHALFHQGNRLALVTAGKQTLQFEKLKKAGFELSMFSKIMIPEDSIKRPCYEALLKEFSVLPSDCAVVGDRILIDLLPAHELGFRTVHMKWGRGLLGKKNEPWIDHTIRELSELLEYF